jgi:hypothetical protein
MTSIHTVQIQFPEIALATRDAHKLRGYFGRLFETHSPLLHNHLEGGGLRYAYPPVQYKVLNQVPTLLGLEEGAKLLIELFLKIKEIQLRGKSFPVLSKHIKSEHAQIGVADELYQYQFQTLWMALNQQNYQRYRQADEASQKQMLQRIAIGNILSLLKGLNIFLSEEERIMIRLDLQPKTTQFKDQDMLAFEGSFTTNVLLPGYIGLGKAVSRGFGSIRRID